MAFRPVRNADLSAQLVTSLAVATILQNVVTAAVDARAQSVADARLLSESTSIGAISVPNLEFLTLGLTAIVLAGLGWLLYRTRTGLAMRAAAENFEMARLLGVRADRVIAIAFAISGALAAAVGVLMVMQTGQVSPTMGLTPVLVGFVAVVIGGFGRIFGAVIGGLLLGHPLLPARHLPAGRVWCPSATRSSSPSRCDPDLQAAGPARRGNRRGAGMSRVRLRSRSSAAASLLVPLAAGRARPCWSAPTARPPSRAPSR